MKSETNPLIVVVLFAFLSLCTPGFSLAKQADADTSQILTTKALNGSLQGFKQFLSDPPVIAEMVAQICEPKTTNDEVSCYFVLMRYQRNGFFYREAPNLLDLATTNFFEGYRLSGYYDSNYWHFSLDGATLQKTSIQDQTLKITLEHQICKASLLLNLGIFGSLPASVVWDGEKIKPFTNYYGVGIQGYFDNLQDDSPVTLHLSVNNGGTLIPWMIDYEFSKNESLPQGIPSRITAWSLRGGGHNLKHDVRILTARFSDSPLPKEKFMAEAYQSQVVHQVEYDTTGVLSHNLRTKSSTLVETTLPQPRHGMGKHVLAISAVLNLILISAVIALSRRGRSKTK